MKNPSFSRDVFVDLQNYLSLVYMVAKLIKYLRQACALLPGELFTSADTVLERFQRRQRWRSILVDLGHGQNLVGYRSVPLG